MRMRVLIAGGGFVGAELAHRLQAEGDDVCVIVRSAESAVRLRGEGLDAHALDLGASEASNALRALGTPQAVVACASTRGGSETDYRHVYYEGTRTLLAAFPEARMIYTGSTSVYAQRDGSVVTEASEAAPQTATGRVLRESEELVLSHGGVVLRLAGLYGGGRWAARDRFLAGEAVLEKDQRHFLNLIHRNDAVTALILLLRTPSASGIYNATDGTPITRHELYRQLAAHYGRPLPPEAPASGEPIRRRGGSHKRVESRRLTALGWRPTFPGINATLESEE